MPLQDTTERQMLALPIYNIVDRLAQPPTADELTHISKLIDAGADLEVRYNDGNRETLLEIALTREYTEAALLLVRKGSDMNARCVQDITPFIWAAMKGNAEVLQLMFDTGNTPPPDRDAYDSLGEYKTALMCAADWNNPDCAAILIKNGADMNYKNNAGKSALDYAEEKVHAGVIDVMKQATAAAEAEKFRVLALNGTTEPVTVMKRLQLRPSNGNNGPK
jgi:ankyrin repeat protein